MTSAPNGTANQVQLTYSGNLGRWLAEQGVALAVTTYQTSTCFVVGATREGRIIGGASRYERVMGAFAAEERLWLSTRGGVQLLRRTTLQRPWRGYDAVYVPRQAWFTGELDAHDIAEAADGALLLVATRYNCVARLADDGSCRVVYKPPFISRVAPEDRCHLNGLALRDGAPAFVTAASRSDVVDAWRDRRVDGGVLVDVAQNQVVASGLSMPHSPRWHDGQLYLLNAGTGELGTIELATGRFEAIAFCPGFLRGLALFGGYAVVGMSKPRDATAFGDLPLGERLTKADTPARVGVHVIDLSTGNVSAWLRFEGKTSELFDVALLPEARSIALAPETPDALTFVELDED